MTPLLALFCTCLIILAFRLRDQLSAQKQQIDKETERADHAAWRAWAAEDKTRKLEAHLRSVTGKYAERGAEIEAMKLVLLKCSRSDAGELCDTVKRLRAVKVPSNEDLERGSW